MASAGALPVDPSNVDAFAAWDGGDGDYWADHADLFDRSLTAYGPAFSDATAITERDRVLDVGCGNGQTTRDAARCATSGSALGIDLSSRMIEQARQRAIEAGIENVSFLQADAQVHDFDAAAYDVVISRTGAMFFGDPRTAFSNLGRALRPEGRLVLLAWRGLEGNDWIRDFSIALAVDRDPPIPPATAPGPFALSDRKRVRDILTDAGFIDIGFESVEQPMWFGDDVASAFDFVQGQGFAQFMMRQLQDARKAQALENLRASIEVHATSDGVVYPSAAWIITARRT